MADYFANRRRKIMRSAKNVHDKATIVSIYPREIYHINLTITPGEFKIPNGTYEKPGILVIGSSSWIRNMEAEEMPSLEIPIPSVQVAESIITDYCGSALGASIPDSMPGLFFVPGEKNLLNIIKENKNLIDIAKEKQLNWYRELVKIADIDWSRTNGNPISISDASRLAAEELNFKDKPWMQDFKSVQLVPCKFCGALKNDIFPICQNCKQVTDVVRAKELGLLDQKAS